MMSDSPTSSDLRSDLPGADLSGGEPPPSSSAPTARLPSPRRRRRPWMLFAVAGVACARMFSGDAEAPLDTPSLGATSVGPLPTLGGAGPALAMTASTAPLAPSAFAEAKIAVPRSRLSSRSGAGAPAGKASTPVAAQAITTPAKPAAPLLGGGGDGDATSTLGVQLAARSIAPGRTWQSAVNTADWPAVAQLIDALPEAERGEPGTRYARAVAARELGQCSDALRALSGLESELPLLHEEIKSARAHCQLVVGPYEEAFQYFTREQSPENLVLAARTALNGADLPRAQQTIEKAFVKIKKQGRESKRGQRNEIAARALRARIAEARSDNKAAARDWLWLATQAPTDAASSDADDAYERLGSARLNTAQRLERLRAYSREGQLEHALREHARLLTAPGTQPHAVEVTSALAWAYYHSRKDYLKAAELFRQAAELSGETRVKYTFYTARALSRANLDDQAIQLYEDLVRRYPGSGYTEQAYFFIARLHYGLGRWEKAERAYTDYLDRYARNGGGKYAGSSRYELAISRLGAKQRTDEAAATLGELARKTRQPDRRAMLSHLEAVALETTQEPKKMIDAIQRYGAIINEQPLSFAAMASSARLRRLGRPEAHRNRLPPTPFRNDLPFDTFPAELPEKAKFLAEIGLHTDAERALFDERKEVRRRYSEREGQVLCEMYGSLDRGFRRFSLAYGLLRSDDLGSPPSADNLWAWRCAYPEPYRDIVSAVEERYRLPESLVHAVMRQESGFRPNVVSPAGAIGLMQLMPNTARRAAEEITEQPGAPWVPDPSQPTNVLNNVELGGFYLSKLLSMLGGQMPVAVAAYNAGPSAVSRWLEGGEDLPVDVWVARIPYTETRDYVSYVLGNYLAYRYLDNPRELPELKLALVPGTRAAADAY